MTARLYRDDPYLLEFEARVTARTTHEGRPAVVLDRTAFYAESGGQPWDTGSLGGVPVVAVIERDGDVVHVLDGPLEADAVRGRVDGLRRRDHREQHHGQHLLSRALLDVAGARTVSFHLGAEVSTIDLDREVSEEQVEEAERRTNEAVWSALPVRVQEVDVAEARARSVEPPAEAKGRIRLVEAVGFDLQPCGGTHPRSTAEVGLVLVVGRERYKGASRLRFVCGHRALQGWRDRLAVTDRLAALLSAPLPKIIEAAERAVAELAAARKQLGELRKQSIQVEVARQLAAIEGSPALVVATYEGWAPDDLRLLAQGMVAARTCVALLGSRAERAHLVFAQSDGLTHDIPALLRDAAARLGGRGGGKGNLAQGSGERQGALAEALEDAAARVRRS